MILMFGRKRLWVFSIFPVSGMMFDDFTSQATPVDVGVNLCGTDAFVSQHALDGPKIGASFQQMSGEGVPESVGTDVLG